jgi:hypothetical protein
MSDTHQIPILYSFIKVGIWTRTSARLGNVTHLSGYCRGRSRSYIVYIFDAMHGAAAVERGLKGGASFEPTLMVGNRPLITNPPVLRAA